MFGVFEVQTGCQFQLFAAFAFPVEKQGDPDGQCSDDFDDDDVVVDEKSRMELNWGDNLMACFCLGHKWRILIYVHYIYNMYCFFHGVSNPNLSHVDSCGDDTMKIMKI